MPTDAVTVAAAIRAANNSDDVEKARAMFSALLDAILVVQTAEAVAPGGGPHVLTEDTPMRMATMTGPGGERALPTFTDADALRRWHPDAEHQVGLEAPDLFGKAIEWGFDVVLVNHADEDWIQLRGELLRTLADGRVPAL